MDGLWRKKTRRSRIPPLGSEVTTPVMEMTLTDPPFELIHWTAAMMAKEVSASLTLSRLRHFCTVVGLIP